MKTTSATARSNPICIGLLILAIGLQLYIISLWMHKAPPAAFQQRVAVPQQNCAPASTSEHRVISILGQEQTSLPDTSSAITALHLLQKFIKKNKKQLDALSSSPSSSSTPALPAPPSEHTPGAKANHQHEHADGEEEIEVEQGIKLGAVREDKKHTHHAHGGHEHHAGDSHDENFLKSKPNLYKALWLNISATWADDVLHPSHYHRLSQEEKNRIAVCNELQAIGEVRPDESWNKLPEKYHAQFDENKCADYVSTKMLAEFIQKTPELYDRQWAVPKDRDIPVAEKGMEDKVIAIVAAMTTRTLTINGLDDLALFRDLLPSFLKTIERGFEYWFYIGYDKADPWLDNADHLAMMRAWFQEWIATPALREGIHAKLVFATFENPYHRPGPAMNYVTGVAYEDGATWIYRINDDQRFETPWAKVFVDALTTMGPPYGVVGPACAEGATHILVVDFVHRTHHEIFPTHYAPSLMAWHLDNWISQVYGRKRTLRVTAARITHLTNSHSTRYAVHGYSQYFRGEVVRGRAMFEEYLSHTPGMADVLKEYRKDGFSFVLR